MPGRRKCQSLIQGCINTQGCSEKDATGAQQLLHVNNTKMPEIAVQLLAVGLLWGVTNPFIRLGSRGIESVKDTGSKWRNILLEVRMIGSRWRYWVPFGLNQCGSALYVWTLQSASITVAVPVANSLSFAFTAITGYALGEKLPGKKVILGTLLICCGSTLMIYEKVVQEQQQENQNIPFQ
ncbi:transmembrane protein 234 homolog isoform X2 [Drosophila subobscura]|uniref:transmembrane protein 234 homolog isoform X2 n=1 Tax=Drosophila subobscura TaxID=7241 RepID=UPI00155A6F11|nr:transmembrane protein 234 homolog isoform X2 [Drosophila subobscura]